MINQSQVSLFHWRFAGGTWILPEDPVSYQECIPHFQCLNLPFAMEKIREHDDGSVLRTISGELKKVNWNETIHGKLL